MTKKIVQIKKEELNDFLGRQERSALLQSYEWGEFRKETGCGVIRLVVADDAGPIAAATLLKVNLPLGRIYFYCPRGPVVDGSRIGDQESRREILEFLFEETEKIARGEKALFLRFEPSYPPPATRFRIIKTIDIQPPRTLILHLSKSEKEIMEAMRQKTRYNIGLAERRGVTVREAKGKDFEDFWRMMEETKRRDGFRLHGKAYYRKMIELPGKAGMPENGLSVRLFLAEYGGRVIAGNIMAFFGDTAVYMHGASANEFRNVMAPYLLQWHGIKSAKEAGCRYYDFYGIDEHKWPGVTRFKRGFGGLEIEYPGTFDLVFNDFHYRFYEAARFMRRLI